jgi:hypothetical protein
MATLAAAALLVGTPCIAKDFFVSPGGNPEATGAIDDPWDLSGALGRPERVQPGDTVYLRGGVYEAPKGGYFRSSLFGAQDAYIEVRPFQGEHAVIDGGFEVRGAYVVFRDLEVMSSKTLRKTSQPGPWPTDITQPTGFNVFAPYSKIVNNIIHDGSLGISAWKEAFDSEFYGNLIYYHGWLGPDRPHGHGIYMQNESGRKVLAENIVFGQFELGMQFYGTEAAKLDGIHLEGNAIFNSGMLGGRPSRNIHLGGESVAENAVVRQNFTYFPTDTNHGGENNIGYYPFGAGCRNLLLTDNYFVSGGISLTLFKCQVASMSGNLLFGETRAFEPSEYPQNTYISARERPKQNAVFVRPNAYEAGRANIVVYNWTRADRVQVDLSKTGLADGDLYEIRDAQNFFAEPVAAGRYTGRPVSIPMRGSVVAVPVGKVDFPPAHTDREFGVFVSRKVKPAPASYSVFMEAESVYADGGIAPREVESASGGAVLAFSDGQAGTAAAFMDVPAAGPYAVWLRVAGSGNRELLASVYGEVADVFDVPGDPGGGWMWVRLNGRAGDEPLQLEPRLLRLAAGPHLLVLQPKLGDVWVDAILVTSDLELNASDDLLPQ